MKRPRGTEEKTKKNIHLDPMGDKIGRIHMGTQDLGKLQTRKMKGLKRSRDVQPDAGDEDTNMGDEPARSKRKKADD
jgi:ribosome production factor 2